MALEDKTEAPTPRRREEARQEGQVAKSMELNSALVLLASLLIFKASGPTLVKKLQMVAIESFTKFPKHDLVLGDVNNTLVHLLLQVGLAVAPMLIGVAVVGTIASVVQVGLVFSGKALQPKPDRLNPIAGIGRMFSARAGVELLKSILKVVVIGFIVYSFLRDNAVKVTTMPGADFRTTCGEIGQLTWQILLRSALALFVIAAADYIYQRFQLEKQLKMTKQEVKEDMKRTDGDPQIKGKIRQRQREMSQRRMMQEVPKADVVVVNPTHFAVALKYDTEKATAPIVVAKGKDLIALKIRAIAEENKVPIVENVQLARTLYASVEIGAEIPADLYQAVAEILAYVYQLSHKLAS